MIGESTGHHHFDRIIDELDAGVFSGDALCSAHARRVFQTYLARWLKASVEADASQEENSARSSRALALTREIKNIWNTWKI